MALLMTINTLTQEPALYHVTYDCEAKSAAGAAKLYRWSLDIGKTTAVFIMTTSVASTKTWPSSMLMETYQSVGTNGCT